MSGRVLHNTLLRARLMQVLYGGEPGVEYDVDSEDELLGPEGIAKLAAGRGKKARFEMLHNLWSSKRPTPRP